MATIKDIYNDLKAGASFQMKVGDSKRDVLFIGYSQRQPDYGKEYIYVSRYGQYARTVSLKNLYDIMASTFEMNANEFYKTYIKED